MAGFLLEVHLDRHKEWARANLRRFHEAKCKVLPVVWGTPWYQHRLGDDGMERSPVEKDLGILVDKRPDMSWEYALTCSLWNREKF